MHASSYRHMRLSVDKYLPEAGHLSVLEVGSRNANDRLRTHRELMGDRDVEYLGIDLTAGPNVDRVMTAPYSFPVKSRSVDAVISGQVFEHIPFPWATMLEIARVLKPGGHVLLAAPSRGHRHNYYDCWRYYPDGFRALAAWARLRVVEVFTDFPPTVDGTSKHDYAAIDTQHSYWGDTVAVLRKPEAGYPELRTAALRGVVRSVANRTTALPEVAAKPELIGSRRAAHRW